MSRFRQSRRQQRSLKRRRDRISTVEALEDRILLAADDYDVDLDQQPDAFTDGATILRYLTGIRGESMLSVNPTGQRTDVNGITTYLDGLRAAGRLDLDGDQRSLPLSDGLLMLRYLSGMRGNDLTQNAVNPGALRTTGEQVVSFVESDDVQAFSVVIDGGNELGARNANTSIAGSVVGIPPAEIESLLVQTDLNDVEQLTPDASGRFTFDTSLLLTAARTETTSFASEPPARPARSLRSQQCHSRWIRSHHRHHQCR